MYDAINCAFKSSRSTISQDGLLCKFKSYISLYLRCFIAWILLCNRNLPIQFVCKLLEKSLQNWSVKKMLVRILTVSGKLIGTYIRHGLYQTMLIISYTNSCLKVNTKYLINHSLKLNEQIEFSPYIILFNIKERKKINLTWMQWINLIILVSKIYLWTKQATKQSNRRLECIFMANC